MLLTEKISSSESKYMKILEEFFDGIYDSSLLPSHGIDHHRRVWYYAKEIIKELDTHNFIGDDFDVDKLIISCFLHDAGMVIDTGLSHGAESRKICQRFLNEKSLPATIFTEVLDAVENHDNKEYKTINKPTDLLTILSVADDLDAFGFTGIYRYIEIYLARSKAMDILGDLIIENCENRFQHFLRTYGFLPELVDRHSKRFGIINSFFNSYNQQIPFYKFDDQSTAGYCGIAEIINRMTNSSRSGTKTNYSYINYPDPVIQWFFSELENELNYFKVLND